MSIQNLDFSENASDAEDISQHTVSLLDVAFASKRLLIRDFRDPTTATTGERQSPLVPIFHGDEVVVSNDPVHWSQQTADHALRTIRIVMDLQMGSFGRGMEQARTRFADRSIDGHYVLRSLQPPLSEYTVIDWMTELYMLTEAKPKHPNILQAYGMRNEQEHLLAPGRMGSFIITDRVVELLPERIDSWRRSSKKLHDRLEIAMDVASALVYLHSQNIVYHLTPSKVGFDSRYGRIKLCQFGHARHVNSTHFPCSLQTSDDGRRVLLYAAPEVYAGTVSLASDSYAFAMLLWEMVTLKVPFRRCASRAELYYRTVQERQRPELDPYYWSSSLMELVTSAWDPTNRSTMKVVCDGLETALLFSGDDNDAKHDSGRTPGTSESDSKNSSFITTTSGVFRDTDEENEEEMDVDKRDSVARTRSAGDPPLHGRRPPPARTHSADGSFRTPAPRRKKLSARGSSAPQSASAVDDRKLKLSRSPDGSRSREESSISSQSPRAGKTPRRGSRKLMAPDMKTPDGRSRETVEMTPSSRRSPATGRGKERSATDHTPRRLTPQRSVRGGSQTATRRASEDLLGFKFEESLFKAGSQAPRRRSEFLNTSSNANTMSRSAKSPGRPTARALSERDIFHDRLSSRDYGDPKTPRNRRPSGSHIAALMRSKSTSKSPNDKSDRQAQQSRLFDNQPSITPNSKSSGDLKACFLRAATRKLR